MQMIDIGTSVTGCCFYAYDTLCGYEMLTSFRNISNRLVDSMEVAAMGPGKDLKPLHALPHPHGVESRHLGGAKPWVCDCPRMRYLTRGQPRVGARMRYSGYLFWGDECFVWVGTWSMRCLGSKVFFDSQVDSMLRKKVDLGGRPCFEQGIILCD